MGVRLERHELRSDYDLHSHTTASDGCLTPEALVTVQSRCASAPWRSPTMTPQLNRASKRGNFTFGTGTESYSRVEISTVWENHEIHIVGLNIILFIR